jgi:DNA-binding IclR family transcriptional regulator
MLSPDSPLPSRTFTRSAPLPSATNRGRSPKIQASQERATDRTLEESDPASRYTVPALARGLEILGFFNREQPVLTGAQLAKLSGLPRTSVFRMLQTLEQAGYVDRIGPAGIHPSYRLGLAVLRLGFEYLSSQELTELGRPVIESLSDTTGHTCHIVVRDGDEVVIVAKSLGRKATFHSIQVGARLPAHATVLGRVLLGGMSLVQLQDLYAHRPMISYTAMTPTTPEDLKALIDEAVTLGVGVSQGGFESGISTVAAPVHNAAGKIAAAIGVTVMASRIDPANLPSMIEQVKAAAQDLSWRLTHTHSAS